MKTKIAKDFYWEMSHRLPYHDGLCRNLHGHSYKMNIEIEGETKEDGMLLDYYYISKIVKPLVEALDHSFVVDDKDDLMIDFLNANNFKMMIIPCYSTAENLAAMIRDRLLPEFRKYDNIQKLKIRLFETESVYAEVETEL